MEFLVVLLGVFAIFIPALMLPGPDFIAVIRSSMTHGAIAGIVSLFMSSGPVMRRFNKSLHWIERIAGAGFIVLGGKVLVDSRNPVTP